MRRSCRLAVLGASLFLSACGPIGVIANSAVKESQGHDSADIEQTIRQQLAQTPNLRGIKVSVAIDNVWRNAFQTHYSVLLAGTAPNSEAHDQAIATVRRIIADDDALVIADQIKVAR